MPSSPAGPPASGSPPRACCWRKAPRSRSAAATRRGSRRRNRRCWAMRRRAGCSPCNATCSTRSAVEHFAAAVEQWLGPLRHPRQQCRPGPHVDLRGYDGRSLARRARAEILQPDLSGARLQAAAGQERRGGDPGRQLAARLSAGALHGRDRGGARRRAEPGEIAGARIRPAHPRQLGDARIDRFRPVGAALRGAHGPRPDARAMVRRGRPHAAYSACSGWASRTRSPAPSPFSALPPRASSPAPSSRFPAAPRGISEECKS